MKKNYLSVTWVVVALAVFCQATWGSAFPLIKKGYALFGISGVSSPLVFGGIRFILASFILFLIVLVRDRKFPLPDREHLKGMVILGLIQTYIVYLFEYISLNYCSGVSSSIVNSVQPFAMTLFACYVFRTEKMSLMKILGISLGFAGIIICFTGEELGELSFMGEGLMIISSCMFAFGANFAKKLVTGGDTVVTTAYNLFTGGLGLLLTGLAFGGRMTDGGSVGYSILLILSLISAVCFLIWTSLSKYNHISRIAPYQFVNPVSGVICSALILGENLFKFKYLITLVLVSVGIIITNSAVREKNSL
ncbi:MAG: DMT family transporter [Sphaerochaetaceae bacterium]|nr:DMT family transporter [Sphaerochaetaceae bacterium]